MFLLKESVQIRDEEAQIYKGFPSEESNFRIPIKASIGDTVDLTLMLEKEGYLREEISFTQIIKDSNIVDLNKTLILLMTPIEYVVASDLIGRDLMKRFIINPIYFDFDKYNIRPDAAYELDKIVEIMNHFPNMIIDLASHTDCIGSDEYNQKLSDNRAKATMEYLISKGISKDRLTCKGYGKSKPVNNCACKDNNSTSTCNPAMQELNRRTEFIVRTM